MIKLFSQGRLGNQMFQYAALLDASNRLKIPFEIIDFGNDTFLLPRYFVLDSCKKSMIRFKIENFIWSLRRKLISLPKNLVTISSENGLIGSEIQRPGNYVGFFQSLYYFKGIEQQIHKELKVKNQYIQLFNEKFKPTFSNYKTICIHVRRGDYLKWIGHNKRTVSLPISYYLSILEKIDLENKLLIFISDDIEYCREHFSHISNQTYFSKEDFIIDFQLLQNSDYLVLSNSSFSWWGAFLKTKPNSLVFAPNKWIGFDWHEEDPKGISHGLNWEWVDYKE